MSQKTQRNRRNKEVSQSESGSAYVRKSTLVVAVIAALLCGVYIGTLMSSFTGQSATQSVANTGGSAPADDQSDLAAHIAQAKEATEKNPQDAQAWIHLGNLYYNAGKAAESVMAYTKALEITPNNANVLTDRGTMYRELGKFDLAIESFKRASNMDPSHENSLFNTGIVLYFDLGRKAEAREVWKSLLRMNPRFSTPTGQSLENMLRDLP